MRQRGAEGRLGPSVLIHSRPEGPIPLDRRVGSRAPALACRSSHTSLVRMTLGVVKAPFAAADLTCRE
jgi:hypothetical protein